MAQPPPAADPMTAKKHPPAPSGDLDGALPPTQLAIPRPGGSPPAPAGAPGSGGDTVPGSIHDPPTVLAAPPEPRRVGNLELLERLGAGGMGEVWKARDPELDRLLAVKLVARDPRVANHEERFRREARAAAAVAHPNVAQVYFAGVHEGRLFYAMELVRGRSLGELLVEHGHLSGSRCVGWLRQACEGLRAAQQVGVIHRDIKPSNLMVEESGRLKIVDFGLARRLDVDITLTRAGVVMGTPSYMSPEQAHGSDLDHRSDIYSLGATFYHLLAGEPPFVAPTAMEVLRAHLTAPLPPLRSRNPAVPEAVARVVERMLAKEPADRFQGYDEVLAALDGRGGAAHARALAEAPVEAPAHSPNASDLEPPSATGPRARTWATLALAAITAALVVGAVARWRGTTAPGAPAARPASVAASDPAPAAAPAAPQAPSPPTSPAAVAAAPPEGRAARPATPSDPLGAQPATAPGAPAEDPMEVTERNLRALASTLLADARSLQRPAADIAELVARHGLAPALAEDGWGSPVRLERPPIGPPMLVSMGPDRQPRTADDLVFLGGQLRPVPPRALAFGPEP
jgi:serine/threonine-protein kinase